MATRRAQLKEIVVSATQKLLRFGVFELNLDTEELRKSETVVKLPPQSFKLLALLANHAGQVVSRDEIQKELWGEETFVDFEHGVNKCIKQIRRTLGDDADHPLYIETLPRHGYRFLAPVVSKVIPAPRPRVVESDSGIRTRIPILTGRIAGVPTAASATASGGLAAALDTEAAAEPQSEIAPPVRSGAWRVRFLWIAAAVLLAAVGGGLYWRLHRPRVLTEKDTVVIAEFDNKTGDPAFDLTLKQALSSQLGQSPFLNLLPDTRITQTLGLMRQPKDARLTGELAREVCQRTASAATIEGSISTLGNLYVVGVKALGCPNGDLLADEQVTAENKEHVLKALGQAATKLRKRLGESLASVQKYDAPPEDVTTASLAALQAYSLGYQAMIRKGDCPAAILLFQRAISLDPNFAMAYARLGTCFQNQSETERAAENMRKAYDLRERAGEREKLYIISHYEHVVIGNLEAARKTYETWAATYPRDYIPPGNLTNIYTSFGDYDKAIAAAQETVKLNPGSGQAYANLVFNYLAAGRFEEARATAQEAQAHSLDNADIHRHLYVLDFLQHDMVAMEQQAAGLMGKPDSEATILYPESDTAAYAGQFAKARKLTQRAVLSAEREDEQEAAADYRAAAALREALVGNMEAARRQAQVALARPQGKNAEAMLALALALAGDSAQATRLADDLARRFPEDTIMQVHYLPPIRAAVAQRSGNPASALEALTPAAHYELGLIIGNVGSALYPVYLRGEAFLALHQGGAAAAEFQKILDHPGVVQNELIGALAHLGLGRAYVLSGDTAKAKAAYQDFLTLWKDADPDIPILQQAKAEYAKLP
jgi:DNA-binding winged helix-turn-helix (wHTH) protein/tetratricopeptide (TPR) repeat protein